MYVCAYVCTGNLAYGPSTTGHINDPVLKPQIQPLPTASAPLLSSPPRTVVRAAAMTAHMALTDKRHAEPAQDHADASAGNAGQGQVDTAAGTAQSGADHNADAAHEATSNEHRRAGQARTDAEGSGAQGADAEAEAALIAQLALRGTVVHGCEPMCEPAIVTVRYLGFHRVWQVCGLQAMCTHTHTHICMPPCAGLLA